MVRKLKILTITHTPCRLFFKLVVHCLWCQGQRRFSQLAIIFGEDCLRIYAFIISDPLTRFRKWKFANFGREKGVTPLQQDFREDFGFFSLKIQVLEC